MKRRVFLIILTVFMVFNNIIVANAAESQIDKIVSWAEKAVGDDEKGEKYAGYCQAFVLACYHNGGADVSGSNAGTAREAFNRWCVSTDINSIPVGAVVYFDCDVPAGHAGIYVGNNKFIHASQSKRAILKTEFNSYYKKEFLGWGWEHGRVPEGANYISEQEVASIVYENNKYAVYNSHISWSDAKAKCEELGGHLVTITSAEEQNAVISLVQKLNKPCWIGASRSSSSKSFSWVTGESFNYTNWDADEPSYKSGENNELYVGIYANDTDTKYSTTGKWNDFAASTTTVKGFVCEWDSSSAISIPDGTYQIVSALNGEKSAISIEGDSLKSKANAHLWERHIGNSEKFNITKSGDYYTIINFNSGKALDVEDGSKKSGANVWQYEPNNSDAQKWQFEDAGDGYVYIKSALGKYLDVSGGKSANGTNIQVYTGNQSASQKWRLIPVYCLDLNGIYEEINTGSLTNFATADVYINGNLEGDDITDYCFMLPEGTKYDIKDIKVNSEYTYDGLSSGKLSGTINGTVNVNLEFSKAHTHSFVGKYYDNKHPHKEYKKCSCGAVEYTGATKQIADCSICYPTHTHSYSGKYYDDEHPHKEYQKCSCDAVEYTGGDQENR